MGVHRASMARGLDGEIEQARAGSGVLAKEAGEDGRLVGVGSAGGDGAAMLRPRTDGTPLNTTSAITPATTRSPIIHPMPELPPRFAAA